MKTSDSMLKQILEFFNETDSEWLLLHMDVTLDDKFKTMNIVIHDINDQEFGWIKDES